MLASRDYQGYCEIAKLNAHHLSMVASLILSTSVKQTRFAFGWTRPWMQFMCVKLCFGMPLNGRSKLTSVDYMAALEPILRR